MLKLSRLRMSGQQLVGLIQFPKTVVKLNYDNAKTNKNSEKRAKTDKKDCSHSEPDLAYIIFCFCSTSDTDLDSETCIAELLQVNQSSPEQQHFYTTSTASELGLEEGRWVGGPNYAEYGQDGGGIQKQNSRTECK